jgi:tetratricopeptide (TPR) repeat protein
VRGQGLARAYDTAAVLQQRAGRVRDLRFTFRYYPDQTHGALPLRGIDDGLRMIFDGWNLGDASAVFDQGGLPAIEKHYATLAARLGFPVVIPADPLFLAFNNLEGARRYQEAAPVIARAVELHPGSTTALYYQARLKNEMGDKPAAVETLRKALLIAPNDSGARSLLRQMQVDPDTIVAPVKVSTQDLAKFTGRYGNPMKFEVIQQGDKLVGRNADREYELAPLTATRFHYSIANVYEDGGNLAFRVDSNGKVTGVVFEDGGVEFAKAK